MALTVLSTMFNSGGGGGSSFYMGRGDRDGQQKRRDEAEEVGELEADALEIGGDGRDGLRLPARQPSKLSLWQPRPPAPRYVDEAAVLAELEDAIQSKMRVLGHGVARMERDYARRLRAEVGEMLIGA